MEFQVGDYIQQFKLDKEDIPEYPVFLILDKSKSFYRVVRYAAARGQQGDTTFSIQVNNFKGYHKIS